MRTTKSIEGFTFSIFLPMENRFLDEVSSKPWNNFWINKNRYEIINE